MTDTDTQADRFEQMMWQAVDKLFKQHDGKLESMNGREQELVLIWRAEADIGNGGILQFVCNWGFPAAEKTCSVLKKNRRDTQRNADPSGGSRIGKRNPPPPIGR